MISMETKRSTVRTSSEPMRIEINSARRSSSMPIREKREYRKLERMDLAALRRKARSQQRANFASFAGAAASAGFAIYYGIKFVRIQAPFETSKATNHVMDVIRHQQFVDEVKTIVAAAIFLIAASALSHGIEKLKRIKPLLIEKRAAAGVRQDAQRHVTITQIRRQ